MPKDKFGEAEPIGSSSPEIGARTVSGATSNDSPAPSDLGYVAPTPPDSSTLPPPPTFQYASPPPGSVPAATTERNWYAILSLIFGFVGPGLIGIGLGVAGLRAAKQGRATNGTLATIAIVVNCVALVFWGGLVLFAINSPDVDGVEDPGLDSSGFSGAQAGYTEFGDLRVGHCIAEPDYEAEETSGLIVVNCTTPHWGQLFAIDSFPAGDYPGEEEVSTMVDEACNTDEALGSLAYDLPDDLYLWYYWPTEESWLDGDREYDCIVYSEGGPLEQSYVS